MLDATTPGPWRSVRGTKATWTEDVVKAVALDIYNGFLAKVQCMLSQDNFCTTKVIALQDESEWTVTEKDIRIHHMMVRPVIRVFRTEVPLSVFVVQMCCWLLTTYAINVL